LKGEMSASEAARRHGVSEQSVHNWKSQFLDGGRAALVAGKSRPSSREAQLEATKAALGEAHVELRVLKRVAEALNPSRSAKVIRVEEDLSVKRITGLLGMPCATWYCHRVKHLAGDPMKGPWPAPLTDWIEPLAAK